MGKQKTENVFLGIILHSFIPIDFYMNKLLRDQLSNLT